MTGGRSPVDEQIDADLGFEVACLGDVTTAGAHVGIVDVRTAPPIVADVPAVWSDDPDPKAAWKAAAIREQDQADRIDRRFRVTQADRMATLLDADETSMTDLSHRCGADPHRSGSMGERVFCKQTAIAWGEHANHIAHLVHTGLFLRERMPRTWGRFRVGLATWKAVDRAAAIGSGLPADRLDAFDELAADIVVGTAGRMKQKLCRARERLQDDDADERARTTHEKRGVVLDEDADGGASLTITDVAPDLVAFDQALTRAAIAMHGRTGETRTISRLRADIVHDLVVVGIRQAADGTWAGLRASGRTGVDVRLILTVPALAWLGHSAEQAELAGYGLIDLETAKRLAADATSFVRVLTDPVTGVRLAMDRTARTAPADLKRWVQTRDGPCRFPGCQRPAILCDIDHAHEWQHYGVTGGDNLICLCRPDHLAKSNRLLQEELLATGAVRWRTPWREFVDPPPPGHDPAPADLLPPDPAPIPTWTAEDTPQEDPCPF